jgi:hypothetical protein
MQCHHKTEKRYSKVLYQLQMLFYAEWYVKIALAHPGAGCLTAAPPPPRKTKFKKNHKFL